MVNADAQGALEGKVALVTGGSRGLGRQMVLAFARAGADVVITSRKLDQCELIVEEIGALAERRAMAWRCHVGKWADVDALVDAAYAEMGRVDILVNNAGVSPLYGPLTNVSEELFDKVIAVNLKGPFRLAVRGRRTDGCR